MGFGHRVYRAYDPRAAALRKVAEAMAAPAGVAGRSRSPSRTSRCASSRSAIPERPLKTNVEYYAAPVLQGVGLPPDLFPATFALARTPAGRRTCSSRPPTTGSSARRALRRAEERDLPA